MGSWQQKEERTSVLTGPGEVKPEGYNKIGDSARRIRIIILTCIDTNNRR